MIFLKKSLAYYLIQGYYRVLATEQTHTRFPI